MSPVPQTDIRSWRTTTIFSVKAGLVRDEGCHSYSWSCCCKCEWKSRVWFVQFISTLKLKGNMVTCPSCRAGIQAACPGGEIVYCTCTLSHNQNQSVVEQAIHLAQESHGIQLQVSQTHTVLAIQTWTPVELLWFCPLKHWDVLIVGIQWQQMVWPLSSVFFHPCPIHTYLQVVDLHPLTYMFRKTFHFAPDLHLGEMVIPHLAANFGPIYMCKLRRLT